MKSLWVFLVFLIVLGAWMGFNYWRLRRAASVIDNEEFADKIHGGQLIDLRDPSEFKGIFTRVDGHSPDPTQSLDQPRKSTTQAGGRGAVQ